MPAKRRRASEAESSAKATDTSQRRVTRSSARPKASAATTTKAPNTAVSLGDPRREPESKKTSKTPRKKAPPAPKKAQKLAAPDEPTSPDEPVSQSQHSKAMTIVPQSNTTQPIQCQLYTARQHSSNVSPTLIFTHGAGGTLAAPAVQNFCTGYREASSVLAFQGSMNLKSRVKSFKSCVRWLEGEQQESRKQGLILGGRSMGARAAVLCASEVLEEENEGEIWLVLISYPLVGPKQDLRDQILFGLPKQVRVLFVIGDRDSMCPVDILESVRSKMKASNGLVIVRGADHGMHVRGGGKDADRRIGEATGHAASQWVNGEEIVGDNIVYIGDEVQHEEE